MIEGPYIAEIASLIGDPARANMLSALMDGRALTATELSLIAGVTPQTASSHLGKMQTAGLLSLEKQGRHRYFRLSGQDVADALEALMVLSSQTNPRKRHTGPKDQAMRHARTCYDHLAGCVGVALTDALIERGLIRDQDHGLAITEAGSRYFEQIGIDIPQLKTGKRAVTRPCLDWSERRPHLGGALGAAILDRFLEKGWLNRRKNSRTIQITPPGYQALREEFGIPADLLAANV
ncbi:ArsR/SmtB family transcription factor [Aestuariispira insulae]|uniref:ArsR family transcriptional regulator n=1 Tax=Aestuariispira insulae TaxID=1461337 RepID=A0A3D9HXN0_9PROT|nr:winged helix-turn-helix domain-containing protein [Aestuariispira insulae]RED54165.1 ArsR family transcriptional regulator [Aestuariispira insulae]